MIIKELKCTHKEDSIITVQLNYDEVRDIANTCYYATQFIPSDQREPNRKAKIAANKTKFLFDMIKHGNIQPETIRDMFSSKFGDDSNKKSVEDC